MSRTAASALTASGPALALASSIALFAPAAHASVDVGVGLMGTLGANILENPDRRAGEEGLFYPGYMGATVGGGLVLDGRVLEGILGLEVDILRSRDSGNGEDTYMGRARKHTLGQTSWHVPVLLKATVPSPLVAPQFFLGPEFVFPSTPESKLDPADGFSLRAKADSYVMITAGVGLEIKLPLPVIDIRVPIALRASYNPGVPSAVTDRVDFASGTYQSEWKYAVNFTGGALVVF